MARDAAEGPGVPVVDLAPDEARLEPLVAVELGGGDPRARPSRSGRKPGRCHPERRGDELAEEPVERRSRAALERPAEQHVAQIAVGDRARDRVDGLCEHGRADRRDASTEPVELAMRHEPGGVGEQLSEREVGSREALAASVATGIVEGPGAAFGLQEA